MPFIITDSEKTTTSINTTSDFVNYQFDISQSDVTFLNNGSYPIELLINTVPIRTHIINPGMQIVLNDIEITGFSAKSSSDSILQISSSPFENENPNIPKRLNKFSSQLNDNVQQVKNIKSPYNYQGAVFTFVDDDGNNRAFDIFKPILDAKGVKATFGIITNYVVNGVASAMTVQRLKQLQDEGHEIVSHSKSHSASIWHDNLATVLDSSFDSEMKDSQQWLKDNGFNGYDTLVYPYGQFGSESVRIKKIARKYYNYAINSGTQVYNSSPVDNMYMNRYQLNMANTPLVTIQAKIDEAITNNGWLVFLMHSGATTEVDANYVGAVIDYIKSKNGTILPFRQASALKGNAISIGEYTDSKNRLFIGLDGATLMTSDNISNYLIKSGIYTATSGNTMDDSVTKFDRYKTTITQIGSGSSDPLTGTGGVLSTYYGDYNFSYQTYISTNMKYYIRYWNEGSSSWGTWNDIVVKERYKFVTGLYTSVVGQTMDDSITKFDKYKVTVVQITSGTKDPLTMEGGTLETYRWDENYNYQRFISATTGQIFHRKWIGTDAGGSWGVWKSLTTLSDTTSKRPDQVYIGQPYFDITLNKPIFCKTLGVKEVDTLTITAGAIASGNITIAVEGVTKTVTVSAGDTIQAVADKIRTTVFTLWGTNKYITINVTGTGDTIVFSRYDAGVCSAPTITDTGATGVTGTFARNTIGTANIWVDATGATV